MCVENSFKITFIKALYYCKVKYHRKPHYKCFGLLFVFCRQNSGVFILNHPKALLWLEYGFCGSQLLLRLEFIFLILDDTMSFAILTDAVREF